MAHVADVAYVAQAVAHGSGMLSAHIHNAQTDGPNVVARGPAARVLNLDTFLIRNCCFPDVSLTSLVTAYL